MGISRIVIGGNMAGEAAALLDELMGKRRNVLPGKEVKETEWWDLEVCKHFLCGFCPCDLFVNTRADMGSCSKLHDEKLRQAYEASDRCGKMGYEQEFLVHLEKLIRSLDRRITHGKERLRKSAEAKQKQMSENLDSTVSEKLRHLNVEINSRVTRLEELGQKGEVEEAQVLLKEVEALERERERNRTTKTKEGTKTLAGFEVDANDFHEKMELCDVCGSFLVIGDSQSRVDAHLLGKQHMGYARIRAAITELKSKPSGRKPSESHRDIGDSSRPPSQDHRRRDSHRSRSRDRRQRSSSQERKQRRESRNRSRSRERRRSRDHRHRSRSRERRHRSRSRERRHRSRSRERRHRSRTRSRSKERRPRSRSKERRPRSRSKERRPRSRSKERRPRSRSRERRPRSRSRERRQRSRSKERRNKERKASLPSAESSQLDREEPEQK